MPDWRPVPKHFQPSIRHNPIVEGIRTADYNYRSADTDLFAETDNKQSEESADNTVFIGQTAAVGPSSQNNRRSPSSDDPVERSQPLCRQTVAAGSGNVVSMTPMKVFKPMSLPRSTRRLAGTFHGTQRQPRYRLQPYLYRHPRPTRLPSRTHHPALRIAGTLPARVTAAENCTYAYIDDGRYRVKLPLDLDEWSPGGESRPVRLAKTVCRSRIRHPLPLHEGTEVMLSFVQGNPDRPYISGVMHDSAHTDHIPADWNTRNVIRTWANNKLRMEDLQGQEHIKLATDYQKSQLNLGHIVDSNRNKRGENGEGFELRTDGWGAVRAGKGIPSAHKTRMPTAKCWIWTMPSPNLNKHSPGQKPEQSRPNGQQPQHR